MSLSFDDLTTWYQQTIAEREKAARTLPDPQTPVEFAQAQLAALADLDGRVSAPVAKATAATASASGKAATSSGSTASAST